MRRDLVVQREGAAARSAELHADRDLRLTAKGFIVIDYAHRAGEAIADLSQWIAEGMIAHAEDIQEGIENTPKTFLRLFEGKNLGKQLLKIADPA